MRKKKSEEQESFAFYWADMVPPKDTGKTKQLKQNNAEVPTTGSLCWPVGDNKSMHLLEVIIERLGSTSALKDRNSS